MVTGVGSEMGRCLFGKWCVDFLTWHDGRGGLSGDTSRGPKFGTMRGSPWGGLGGSILAKVALFTKRGSEALFCQKSLFHKFGIF